MKIVGALCAAMLGIYGCAGSAGGTTGSADLTATPSAPLGADAIACDAGGARVALVAAGNGKTNLAAMTPSGSLFALEGTAGTLSNANGLTFRGKDGSTLTLGADLAGSWTHDGTTARVSCAKAAGDEAAMWRAVDGLATYMSDVDDLARTVVDEMASSRRNGNTASPAKAPTYKVYAVETAKVAALAPGADAKDSAGTLPEGRNTTTLDDDDWSYGGLSAAYGLGGGDDWGEWFQGASDGVSLSGDLGATTGTFSAHEKVTSLSSVVDSAAPSVIALTVGTWTFLIPDAFSK